ncbi:MAG TPA: FtsQ-type POTRA domain-containing protein [Clostridia bacterium]|nr:FtsQ-type POTRA domain-containing protein [Clostridia bacterium]
MGDLRRREKRDKVISRLEFLLIGLALLIAITVFAFLQSDYFSVAEIRISGNKLIQTEQLLVESQIVKGMNIFRVNLEKTSRILNENPRIKQVNLSRILPNIISIEVEERTPIALIPQGDEFLELDGEGVVLAKGEEVSSYNLPIITGLLVKEGTNFKIEDSDLIQLLEAFSNLSPEELKEISEVNISSKEGLLLYTIDGMQVRLGRPENLTGKVRFFLSILSEIRAKNIRPGYYIDVSERGYSVIKM